MKKKNEPAFCIYCQGEATTTKKQILQWKLGGTLWQHEFEIPVCSRCADDMTLTWADVDEREEPLKKGCRND